MNIRDEMQFILIIPHPNRATGGNGCPSVGLHASRESAEDRLEELGNPDGAQITPYKGTFLEFIVNKAHMTGLRTPEGV